jgi:hypothetical protein
MNSSSTLPLPRPLRRCSQQLSRIKCAVSTPAIFATVSRSAAVAVTDLSGFGPARKSATGLTQKNTDSVRFNAYHINR